MKKIRVLHIIKSLGRGGAEMLLPETLKLHDKSKFSFHYIYFLPWKNQMVEYIVAAGGTVTCFPADNNIKIIMQYKLVSEYCKINEINLIHCHLPWSGFLGRLIFRNLKIPVIYTEHNIQEKYHFATKNLNKITFNSQTLALGVSEDVTKSIENNIKLRIPVKTLLNGVNTNRFIKDKGKGDFIRNKYNIPIDAVVIGNVAVFREQKNIPVWLKAFKEVSLKYSHVYGILVGTGIKEEEIIALVNDLNLTEKIIMPGLQTDTIPFFSAMDIFMMSSDFEGLPIALLEAMSMECAIVSTKAGGVIEAVRNKKDGILCPIGSFKCLADAAEELVKNIEFRKILQAAARSRVKEGFSLGTMVNELEEIYIRNKK